jgi:hypothetical protein
MLILSLFLLSFPVQSRHHSWVEGAQLTDLDASWHELASHGSPLGWFSRAWQWLYRQLSGMLGSATMGILFFGVLTPAAVMMRWAGKDVLRLRFDPETPSYWIIRPSGGYRQTSMTSQF